MIMCIGIEFLNQCENAVLCENGIGCNLKCECDFQRPKNTSSKIDYAKLAKWVHDCVSFGGSKEQVEDYLRKNFT